jgi:hypothetical protein
VLETFGTGELYLNLSSRCAVLEAYYLTSKPMRRLVAAVIGAVDDVV